MKRARHILFYGALLLFLPFCLTLILPDKEENGDYIIRGHYSSTLSKIRSFKQLDSAIASEMKIHPQSELEIADSLLQWRFYHGTARLNYNENWLAYLLGKLIWDDLRMIVIPEKLLLKKVGVCNQINIVFQTFLENHQYTYRSVGFRNHLLTEVFYDNSWHLFDADYEPDLKHRPSAKNFVSDPLKFKETYVKTYGPLFNDNFENLLNTDEVAYYPENTTLAVNLRMFQQVTSFISTYGWLILLALYFLLKLI